MQESLVANPPRLRRAAILSRYGTGLILATMFIGTHYPYSIPGTEIFHFSNFDKALHFSAYLVLTVSCLASWEFSTGILRPSHYFFVWLFGTIYGALDEITQLPVGRTCDGMDWLADIVGIIAGLTIFRLIRRLLYRLI